MRWHIRSRSLVQATLRRGTMAQNTQYKLSSSTAKTCRDSEPRVSLRLDRSLRRVVRELGPVQPRAVQVLPQFPVKSFPPSQEAEKSSLKTTKDWKSSALHLSKLQIRQRLNQPD